jgi:hypothetical protein
LEASLTSLTSVRWFVSSSSFLLVLSQAMVWLLWVIGLCSIHPLWPGPAMRAGIQMLAQEPFKSRQVGHLPFDEIQVFAFGHSRYPLGLVVIPDGPDGFISAFIWSSAWPHGGLVGK